MNYIRQLNAFWELMKNEPLSAGQGYMYLTMLDINNQCGWVKWFSVSNTRLAELTGLTVSGVRYNRQVLIDAGLIEYQPSTNRKKAPKYKVLKLYDNIETDTVNNKEKTNNTDTDTVKPTNNKALNIMRDTGTDIQTNTDTDMQTDTDTDTINKLKYKQNKTKNKKESVREKSTPTQKQPYGEFENVLITKNEYDNFKAVFPKADEYIQAYSEYKEAHGKIYNNDFAMLKRWAREETKKDIEKEQRHKRQHQGHHEIPEEYRVEYFKPTIIDGD